MACSFSCPSGLLSSSSPPQSGGASSEALVALAHIPPHIFKSLGLFWGPRLCGGNCFCVTSSAFFPPLPFPFGSDPQCPCFSTHGVHLVGISYDISPVLVGYFWQVHAGTGLLYAPDGPPVLPHGAARRDVEDIPRRRPSRLARGAPPSEYLYSLPLRRSRCVLPSIHRLLRVGTRGAAPPACGKLFFGPVASLSSAVLPRPVSAAVISGGG